MGIAAATPRLLLGAMGICLLGCAVPNQSVRINPDYQGASLTGRTLHVLPPAGLDVQGLLEEFESAFRTQTRDSIYNPSDILAGLFLEKLSPIAEAAPARIQGWRPDTAAYRDTVLTLPDQLRQADGSIKAEGQPVPVHFRFPGTEQLAKAGVEPDLGLQLGRLRFEIEEKDGQDVPTMAVLGAAGAMLTPKPKLLRLSGTFLLWDYRRGSPVAFGWIETASKFKFVMDRFDWIDVVDDAVESIIVNTPLKGKKYAKRLEAAGSAGSY